VYIETLSPQQTEIDFPRAAVAAVHAAGHLDLVSHFRALSRAIPQRDALTFLVRGEEPGESVTFAEMDRRARSLGAHFQRRKAQGERAIMLFDAGVQAVVAFMGCAYGRVIAAPLPAPTSARLDRYLVRVKTVLQDGDARFVLTTVAMRAKLQAIAATMTGFETVEWIAVDELGDASADWVHEPAGEDELVYLQYTSGSTSVPKGVMITQRNLMTVITYNGQVTGCDQYGTGNVCWMPYFHDYAMIDGLLVPMAHGMSIWLMSPFDFVADPARWVRAIDRFRASHASGPNFCYDLIARKTSATERTRLDLSCWRRANNTAEPVRPSTVRRFFETFGPCGVHADTMSPAFALAETTLLVTMTKEAVRTYHVDAEALAQHRVVRRAAGQPGTRELTGCGRLWPGPWNLDVKVVDPQTLKLVPADGVGEVWISGDLVAQGYWNRPETTAEKFHAEIADHPGRRYLRTGDLGFWMGDELVITGRLKDLLIVEGRNLYPQDIEATADAALPALRPGCTIAFSTESDEGEVRAVLVCELRADFSLVETGEEAAAAGEGAIARPELERTIRRAVSEEFQLRLHDIVVLPAGLLPKTTSGKVERSACRALYQRDALMNGVPRRPV
jgi:acyl-CoA synthetase (AMP-forming)/AMP-acid ligase II